MIFSDFTSADALAKRSTLPSYRNRQPTAKTTYVAHGALANRLDWLEFPTRIVDNWTGLMPPQPGQHASTTPKRIIIDATYTLNSGKSSGIERVVRSVLTEWGQIADEGAIPRPLTVVCHAGRFYPVDDVYRNHARRVGETHADVLGIMPRAYVGLAGALCKISRSTKLRKWLLPQHGHLGVFKVPHMLFERYARWQLSRRMRPIDATVGDIVLLPDAYWIHRLRCSVWKAASAARRAGACVGTLLYDLIPHTHPQFVGLKRHHAFNDYLLRAGCNSDVIVAISRTVRDQVRAYYNCDETRAELSAGETFCRDIRSFNLGCELSEIAGPVRPKVARVFADDNPPFLMVATFDPRKNHAFLLDAIEHAWKTQPELKLCLIGRIGSRCDEVVERIVHHPRFGKNLFLFDDCSDAELQHCYRAARGVVTPSVVEGFGLPIVESLWYGKTTLASDTAIHREVGCDDCVYFGLEDPRELSALLVDIFLSDSGSDEQSLACRPRSLRKLTNWAESSRELLAHCLDAQQRKGGLDIHAADQYTPAAVKRQAA